MNEVWAQTEDNIYDYRNIKQKVGETETLFNWHIV